MLKIAHLSKHFGGLKAVENVSFEVHHGEIVGLIGPNGAGKTTLFNLISRFLAPTSGDIRFNGHDLLQHKASQIVELGVVRTFQNIGLFPYLSVLDNLLIGQHRDFTAGSLALALGLPQARREEAERTAKAQALLRSLHIEALQLGIVSGLPYGTQKLIEIARALMCSPRLLLLDEPVAGMTSFEKDHIKQLILKIRENKERAVLLIDHDMSFVMDLCDRIIVLSFGQVLAEGAPPEVQKNPIVIEAYLGEEARSVAAAGKR
jgi:ABC-type branched-subunit amino acid transport system ATPase component